MICIKCKQEVPGGPFCCQCGTRQEKPERKYVRRRGNGSGTAYKHGKYWEVQYTTAQYVEDGKLVRKRATKSGFRTKAEALEYLPELKKAPQRSVPTLRELYRVYSENEFLKLSTSKKQAYRKAWSRLESLADVKVDELITTDLQDCINENATSYYTARDMKVLLSHLYKRAAADQFVPTNLAQYIVLPELIEAEGTPFAQEEVVRMWAAFADGNAFVAYLLLMIYTGMMPIELFSCTKDMVNIEDCEITGCGRKTKIRKESVIVFPEALRPVVQSLIDAAPGDKIEPLRKDEWYDKYHECTKEIGVRDLPPYSCRHTTGTAAARAGLSSTAIQRIMRHAKITTSQRYIHMGTEDAHRGINQLAIQ